MEPSEHERARIEQLRRAMYSRALQDKRTDRPRRELHEEDQGVGEDWTQTEEKIAGVAVAPRFIGMTRKILWWALMGSVLFFIGALLFFAYYFTLGGGSLRAAPSNIDIVVSGPVQVMGGEHTELQIAVTNRNRVALELSDLVVTFPQGTRSVTDFATDLPVIRQPLGTIEPGGRRQGTISAVFSGEAGGTKEVQIELEYRVAGSNSIFIAKSTYSLVFASAPLSVAVEGNTQTISGQPMQFTVDVSSNSNAPLKDVVLSIDFPFGFKFSSAEPKAASGNLWSLGDFAPGERKSVIIQGALSGETGDSRVFRVAAGTRKSPETKTIETKLADTSYEVQVSHPFLGLTVNVNQDSGVSTVIGPAENAVVSVAYENNLSTEITDAIIVARLSGIQIDGSTVHSTDGFYRSSDNVVLWDKTTTNGKLARLAPGAKGTVSFSFTMPSSEVLKGLSNPRLEISVNAAGKRISETGVPQNLQSTAQKTLRLATDLAVSAQGLYYANPFGSSGPMPPKANTETTYALVFTVTNTTNKITGAKLTARLPSYVRWVGIYSPSSENVTFNQLDGTVTWNVGDIAAGTGLGGTQPRQAAIAIGFTPSTSQIGQTPPLLQDIKLVGTDSATGGTVTRNATNITTNISGDPGFVPANATVVR